MGRNKKSRSVHADPEFSPSRRRFVKRIGVGILVTSSYSLFSLCQFGCSSSPTSSDNGDGNNDYGDYYGTYDYPFYG